MRQGSPFSGSRPRPRCWFDEAKCRQGVEALTFYRKDYNERLQQYSDRPLHDWASHGADAFRGLSVRHKTPSPRKPKPRAMFESRGDYAGSDDNGLGWMH